MQNRITKPEIKKLKKTEIFVFGSNSQGNHAGGAAKLATEKFGAEMGIDRGLTGQCYAIDTMSGIEVLKEQIAPFISIAIGLPDKVFLVTEIGCGIAGYTAEQIAPLFEPAKSIDNIHLPQKFWDILNEAPALSGFKGFDKDFKCRDMQFEVGKTFTETDAIPCEKGIHYCTYPLDVFGYYPPSSSRYATVEGSGKTVSHSEDSKIATTRLKVSAEINIPGLVKAAVEFIHKHVDWENAKESNTGNYSAATNTGYKSAAVVEGKESVAISLGIDGRAKGKLGCFLVLAEWKQDTKGEWHRINVASFLVDGRIIKEDAFYQLKNGSPVQCE